MRAKVRGWMAQCLWACAIAAGAMAGASSHAAGSVSETPGVYVTFMGPPFPDGRGSTWQASCAQFFGFMQLPSYYSYIADSSSCQIGVNGNTYRYARTALETPPACPQNASTGASGGCSCDDGYEPDGQATACTASGSGGGDGGGGPGTGGAGGGEGSGGADGTGGPGPGGPPGTAGAPPPADPPLDEGGSCFGNPILPASGEKLQAEVDYSGTGPHALHFIRNFRSERFTGVKAPALAATGLGKAWSHNHAMSIRLGSRVAQVEMEDGSLATLYYTGVAPAGYWYSPNGADSLTHAGGAWTYRRSSDDSTWRFTGTAGNVRLASITSRQGWVTTYAYSGNQLTQVTNPFGRALRFAYTAAGQLASVTTPDGQVISYTADAQGRHVRVNHADGSGKTYLYENAAWPEALTGIVDERGIRYAVFAYDAQHPGASPAQPETYALPASPAARAGSPPMRTVGTSSRKSPTPSAAHCGLPIPQQGSWPASPRPMGKSSATPLMHKAGMSV